MSTTTTTTTQTPAKLPRIKFAAPAGLQIGEVVRHHARGYKFWEVIAISAKTGKATARAMKSEFSGIC